MRTEASRNVLASTHSTDPLATVENHTEAGADDNLRAARYLNALLAEGCDFDTNAEPELSIRLLRAMPGCRAASPIGFSLGRRLVPSGGALTLPRADQLLDRHESGNRP